MVGAMRRVDADLDRLGRYLRALSHTSRLQLLSQLRTPRTVDEIELSPEPAQGGDRPDRPISRQAVRAHLEPLLELGLVRARTADRPGRRPLHEYVLDHAQLFAALEELRQLTALESQVPLDPMATIGLRVGTPAGWPRGAKLVLVHGNREGSVFPLRPEPAEPAHGWVIGRDASAQVRLEYDPYVSHENARIVRDGDRYVLVDLRGATNRASVNWRPLEPGGTQPLEAGDIIGVGRSLLVFRQA